MSTKKDYIRHMRAAIWHIERRIAMPICVKCGEETPHFSMSKENRQMCKDCWSIHDMDRFKTIDEPLAQEKEAVGDE